VRVYTTTPVPELATAGELFAELEAIGYDGAFTYETRHDPFLPLTLAADRTHTLRLGTAVAIAFARTPMLLATIAYDLHDVSEGRFVLGLGTQIRPHIERRFSMPWSRPVARMRELVLAIRAIWDAWEGMAPLDFRGEFYTHTLMPPAFDPGPARFGRAAIHIGGVGPHMAAAAAEVGDGILVHPFSTHTSLRELTVPAVETGLRRAGRPRSDLELVVVNLIATGRDGPELDRAIEVTRGQIAFYASTPAYAAILACSGWEGLHPRLNTMSKEGRWADMPALVPDEVVESIAVVGRREEIPELIRSKVGGVADSVSLECTRQPDPAHFGDICVALHSHPSATG
jgi:probable F420-dependent oxidoreductase